MKPRGSDSADTCFHAARSVASTVSRVRVVPVNDEAPCGQAGRESLFDGLEVADEGEASVVRDEAPRIRTVSNRRAI